VLAASFSASPTNGGAPLIVTFTDTSTGTITNRFWNFGDGATMNVTTTGLTHTYSFPGTNTVTLIVSDPSGSSTNTKAGLIVATSVDTVGDGVADWWQRREPEYNNGLFVGRPIADHTSWRRRRRCQSHHC
jgi:PKD repeat protein